MPLLPFRFVVGLVLLAVGWGGQDVQASAPLADTTDGSPHWIFLAPRPAPGAVSPAAPRTESRTKSRTKRRAEDRRDRRGTNAAARLTRPVAVRYLAALRRAGVVPRVQSRWLHAVSANLTPAQRRQIDRLPFVRRTQPIARYAPADTLHRAQPQALRSPVVLPRPVVAPTAADSAFYGPSYTQLRVTNALPPIERGIHGDGVRLGFLDTRYRGFQHPVFDALRDEGRLLGLRDIAGGTQTNNHGGAVASVAVGYAPGVLIGPAHRADVLAATTEYTPSERNVEEDYFVAGLEWMEAQGADVVNVSLGYTQFDEGERSYTTEDLDGDTAVTTRAVDAAVQLGMAVVVSAGNSGCDDPSNCWFYVGTPADADSAIAVGGVHADGSIVSFSSRGPTADGRIKPDVVAQGQNVVVAWNEDQYVESGGTSFASPLVAAVVAQMLQVNPDLTPMQVRRLLRTTADQSERPDNTRGWGLLDADAAVRAAEHQARLSPPPALVVRSPAPNPARTETTFAIDVPRGTSSLDVSLFDVLGRRVVHDVRSVQPGPNRLTLSVDGLPPGVYLYRLHGAERVATGKLVILR